MTRLPLTPSMSAAAASILATLHYLSAPLLADEGMWTPRQLPEIRSQIVAAGLEIDPGRLADFDQPPLDAIVSLGGCTASFVSADGLVITNHHCAERAIQYNSTPQRNLLEDGFLARSRGEELFAGPGSRVLVTVQVQDVTHTIVGGLGNLHGQARYDAIQAREKALVADCESEAGYRCRVAAFHGGLEYHLVKQIEIRDVRLVYAPAAGIGNFGGDIDNWMWPRQTGDYTFYRAYVGPDGKPADHSPDNVPYHPKHFLKVSATGVHDGDFVMVLGYPGRTQRYKTAREVEFAVNWNYPTLEERYRTWIEILERETRDRPDAAIRVASQLSGLNNSAKNYRGMLDGFAKTDVLERKRADERALREWVEQDRERRERWGAAFATLDELIQEDQADQEREVYYARFARSAELLGAASKIYRWNLEKQKPDSDRRPGYQERDLLRLRESMQRLERSFDAASDRAAWRRFILDYAAAPAALHAAEFDRWFGIEGNTADESRIDARLEEMYSKTGLADMPKRVAWIEATAAQIERSDDPFLQLAVQLMPDDLARERERDELQGQFLEHRPRVMEALLAFERSRGKPLYPDANGTLRVTYGKIAGVTAADGQAYAPFTTVAGVLAKDTGKVPFNSPPKLLEAIRARRYGTYADARLGTVPVDFLSTLDTTGGNSGSPTLNSKGELVGLAFDGTYESINGDWYFDAANNRAIHVDMRYVMWVMDEVDNAEHLLLEMGVPSGVATRE